MKSPHVVLAASFIANLALAYVVSRRAANTTSEKVTINDASE